MNQKDIDKAKKWCEEARQLLKMKRTGGSDETADSKELARAVESVAAELKNQKEIKETINNKTVKNEFGLKLDTYEKEFLRLSEIAKQAANQKNKQLAGTVTAQLQFLHAQMTMKDPEALKNASEKMVAKVRAQYELSLKAAEGLETELKELVPVEQQFVGEVTNIIKEVKNPVVLVKTADHDALITLYMGAINGFERVKPEYDKQKKRSESFIEFDKKRQSAEFEILLVKSALKSDPNVQNMNLSMAESAVRNAIAAAGPPKFDYKSAASILDRVHEECKQVQKSDSFNKDAYSQTTKTAKSLESTITELEKKIDLAQQQYLNATSTFGAVTGVKEVVHLLEQAKYLITSARDKTASAKSILGTEPKLFQMAVDQTDQARDELKSATKERIPEALKTSENAKKVAKKTGGPLVLQWEMLLAEAKRALEELKPLVDVTDEIDDFESLITDASELVAPDKKPRDYSAAVLKLSKYTEIVTKAKNKQPSALKNLLDYPQFVTVKKQILNDLSTKQNLYEVYFGNAYRSELADLEKLVDINSKLAITQAKELHTRLVKELSELGTQAEAARKSMVSYLNEKIEYKEVPTHAKEAAMQLGTLANASFNRCDWISAKRLYDEGVVAFQLLAKDKVKLIQSGAQWEQHSKDLSAMAKFASMCLNWPPLTTVAGRVLESIREARQNFESSKDYEAFSKEFSSIVKSFQELEREAASQNLPKSTEALDLLMKDVLSLRNDAENAIEQSRSQAYAAIAELERMLVDVFDPMENPYRRAYNQILEIWKSQSNIKIPVLPDLSTSSKEDITKEVNKAVTLVSSQIEPLKQSVIRKLHDLVTLIKKANLVSLAGELQEKQAEKFANDPERQISVYISKLLDFGVDTSGFQERRDALYKDKEESERLEGLNKLAAEMKERLAHESKEAVKRKALCEQKGKEAREKKEAAEYLLESNYLKFKSAGLLWVTSYEEYRKALKTQLRDVESLLESDDPDLVDLAAQQFEELRQSILEVAPGSKPSFTAVHKRHKELVQLLGVGTDRVVNKYLKDTHAKLASKLDDAYAKALKTSPKKGLQLLSPALEKEIRDAVALAKERKLERVRIDERITALTNQWTEIKKLTKTWVTEKTTSFANHFDSCIETANSQRKEENGGIAKANATLDQLKKELDHITKDDGKDPRTKLIEKDSEFAIGERNAKELGRQFENEAKAFELTRLKLVTDAFAEKANSKGTPKERDIEIEEGKKVTEGMKKRIGEARKLAGKLSSNTQVAEQQLAAAREILREQEALVQRLMRQTQTTNVNLTKNLPGVLENWKAKVRFFSSTIEQFADKVEGLGDNTELGIDKVQAQKAAAVIRTLKNQFSFASFDKSIDRLIRASNPEERRQAREEALLVMRTQRDNLLTNPVLKRLASNPVDRDSIMTALAYLRQSLKSMEIEVLVGV